MSRRADSYTQWYLSQLPAARSQPLAEGEPAYSMDRPPLMVMHFMFPHKGFSSYTAYYEMPKAEDGRTYAKWDNKGTCARTKSIIYRHN